jgi:hypothetical protein
LGGVRCSHIHRGGQRWVEGMLCTAMGVVHCKPSLSESEVVDVEVDSVSDSWSGKPSLSESADVDVEGDSVSSWSA